MSLFSGKASGATSSTMRLFGARRHGRDNAPGQRPHGVARRSCSARPESRPPSLQRASISSAAATSDASMERGLHQAGRLHLRLVLKTRAGRTGQSAVTVTTVAQFLGIASGNDSTNALVACSAAMPGPGRNAAVEATFRIGRAAAGRVWRQSFVKMDGDHVQLNHVQFRRERCLCERAIEADPGVVHEAADAQSARSSPPGQQRPRPQAAPGPARPGRSGTPSGGRELVDEQFERSRRLATRIWSTRPREQADQLEADTRWRMRPVMMTASFASAGNTASPVLGSIVEKETAERKRGAALYTTEAVR